MLCWAFDFSPQVNTRAVRENRLMRLQEQFGNIDIYLFDQILRGRIAPGMRIFDAGCGGGPELVYLLRAGYEVDGVDIDPRAAAALPPGNFRPEPLESHTYPDAFADVVISSAV